MQNMIRSLLTVVVTCSLTLGSAALSASAGEPLPLDRIVLKDARGDLSDTDSQDKLFRPSVDVRRGVFTSGTSPRSLKGTVKFTDLKKLTSAERNYKQNIYIAVKGVIPAELGYSITRSPYAEGTNAKIVRGDSVGGCRGDRLSVNLATEKIQFNVPLRCFANPKDFDSVRLTIKSTGFRAYSDDQDIVGSDQARSKRGSNPLNLG